MVGRSSFQMSISFFFALGLISYPNATQSQTVTKIGHLVTKKSCPPAPVIFTVILLTFRSRMRKPEIQQKICLFLRKTKNQENPPLTYRQVNCDSPTLCYTFYSFIILLSSRMKFLGRTKWSDERPWLCTRRTLQRVLRVACRNPFERVDLIEPLLFTISI